MNIARLFTKRNYSYLENPQLNICLRKTLKNLIMNSPQSGLLYLKNQTFRQLDTMGLRGKRFVNVFNVIDHSTVTDVHFVRLDLDQIEKFSG